MSLDLDTLEQERTRDLVIETASGNVTFTIRYASPKLMESWRRRVVGTGICRKDLEPAPGRFRDFCRSLAEIFVIGWSGAITPKDTPYSVDRMALILENRADVMRRVQEGISDDQSFFGSNGTGKI